MILDIYNDSIKYSIKNSKSLLYFGLTFFNFYHMDGIYFNINPLSGC